MYDVDRPVKAANAVANPDGSVYRTHQLVGVDWDIVRESCYVLQYCKNACDLLQGSKYVTSNLLLPVIGRMAYISHKDTPLKFEKENVKVLNEDVKEARELLYKETCKRYFNDLADCKLEDFAVATVFDPRYKLFNFKFANRFMRGNFSAEVATKRATKAWVADWKPTPAVADTPEPSAKKQKISSEQRDMLHLKISRWLVRCRRPLSLPEADAEFREVFDLIFKGSYKPPSYNLVVQYVLKLSQQGKSRLITQLAALLEEGILPSLGGDIWSQGGIAIFGILVYWLDENFCIQERLLGALPFSEQRHTAEELEKATKQACAEFGLGEYRNDSSGLVDTVAEYIHATASDNAANIVCGLHSFDGHECANHTVSLIAKTFLDQPNVRKVFMKLRGMTTHFNHSVIGAKLLQECQRKHGLSQSKPPQDNDTRTGWGGACKQAIWFIHNQ
eukprot:gene34479-biopygen31315